MVTPPPIGSILPTPKSAAIPCMIFEELLDRYHALRWEEEPNYPPDFRLAVHTLRVRCGLTISELAIRCGKPTNTMQKIEDRGGPVSKEICEALSAVAKDYRLNKLSAWFMTEFRIQDYNKHEAKERKQNRGRE